MTVGCPGGDHQAQANVQLMLNTLMFGMNAQEAVEAPRFATESVPDSFYPHVYYPNRVSLEVGYPRRELGRLARLGTRRACASRDLRNGRDHNDPRPRHRRPQRGRRPAARLLRARLVVTKSPPPLGEG